MCKGENLVFERSDGAARRFQGFLDFCLLFIDGKVEARPAQGQSIENQILISYHR
ncbi:MAG: hypothetical protein WBA23_06575 [Tunicatimonas sp.]|uniref:hypothetical protein n=1 Tax=Tunicatimonas sp. TaxID=1940096 RepID=UPI003C7431DC